jgi:hypothetical protein
LLKEGAMILEAMNSMRECPVGFVVQSTFDDTTFTKRFVPKVPVIGAFLIRKAIRNGEIYLRPDKIDPIMPEFYILKGWHVRNLSQRKDPVARGSKGIPLKYSRIHSKHG